MKIIIIRGTINSGKTTTSGLIYSELLQFANKQHTFNNKQVESNSLKFNNEGATVDFQAVLIVGKLKIGIVSAGDIAKNLDFDI